MDKAICYNCESLQTITFRRKKIKFGKLHKMLLVGVCDKCNKIVSIPHESVKDLNNER